LQEYSPVLVLTDGFAHLAVRALGVIVIDRLLRQLHKISELNEARESDLAIARQTHESFFAEPMEVPEGFEVGLRLEFLREVGGDYYLFSKLEDSFFLCLGDIAGKGVAAALFTAALSQNVISALRDATDVGQLVRRVNRRMAEVLPDDRFVTLFACTFDASSLTYAIAGHERPLLLQATGGIHVLDDAVTAPLGISADTEIAVRTVEFGQGDVLLAVTDGVTESPPFSLDPWRLQTVLTEQAGRGVQAVCDRVVELLAEAAAIRDDVAIVCIRRSEN
jgi:serine phosphatase RsbU (regulator of sigma subunit)